MARVITILLLVGLLGGLAPAKVEGVKTGKSTPLHQAAVDEDPIRLKELLDSGKYDVNAVDENGRTPLAAAMATCSKCWSFEELRQVAMAEVV